MEVKAGYKKTEIGVFPEDWELTSVEQLVNTGVLEKPLDGNHGEIHPKKSDYVSYGIPFVMANNVQDGHVDLVNCSFIRKEQADGLRIGFSYPGDVLLTHKATIGNTAIVGEIPFDYIMLTPQVTYYRVSDKTRLSNFYLRHFFDSSSFQKVLLSKSGGGTRAYIGVVAQQQLPVVLPPTLAEQEAIAEALSDADALIEALEGLIAKKRQLKQGAMQELLTGKRRLPGFSGEWEEKQLGDMLDFERPDEYIVKSTDYFETGDIPVLTANKSFVLGYTDEEFGIYNKFPVIIFDDFTTDKKYVDFPFKVKSSAIKILKPKNNKVNLQFVYGKMQLIYFPISDHKRYYISEYQHIKVLMPDQKEQAAIAEILSDMDAEITALEAKLSKAREVKAGMMSVLLSGKIRLVES